MTEARTTYTATDLTAAAHERFEVGLASARSAVSEHGLMIGHASQPGSLEPVTERNPARLDERLGQFAQGSDEDIARAVAAARASQPAWAQRTIDERIDVLEGVAGEVARRAGMLAAVLTLEVGKTRLESVGEVDESVELIRYYCGCAAAGFDLRLDGEPGTRNLSVMRPFGVFAGIVPFNFPLALAAGPAAAALVAGNAVVVKPSPTTSWIALLFAEAARDAGLPDGLLSVVTGGDETGAALVDSDIDGLVFTGSHAVGIGIVREFSTARGFVRPAIVEMGGKNPAIVTRHGDLEAAAAGISRSAFSLSGQKCSACSRVLVEREVHDELLDLLVAAAGRWTVGDPSRRDVSTGPLHGAAAFERFVKVTSEASARGRIAHGGHVRMHDLPNGYYVPPTVVADLPEADPILHTEQFLPLVAVERVESFDQALSRANATPYGLTAGLFSRDEAEIERFLDRIDAGTVFVNRAGGATSGGWPGQQSYSGWKGSGSTNRGGLGPRYVEQFLKEQGRNIVGNG